MRADEPARGVRRCVQRPLQERDGADHVARPESREGCVQRFGPGCRRQAGARARGREQARRTSIGAVVAIRDPVEARVVGGGETGSRPEVAAEDRRQHAASVLDRVHHRAALDRVEQPGGRIGSEQPRAVGEPERGEHARPLERSHDVGRKRPQRGLHLDRREVARELGLDGRAEGLRVDRAAPDGEPVDDPRRPGGLGPHVRRVLEGKRMADDEPEGLGDLVDAQGELGRRHEFDLGVGGSGEVPAERHPGRARMTRRPPRASASASRSSTASPRVPTTRCTSSIARVVAVPGMAASRRASNSAGSQHCSSTVTTTAPGSQLRAGAAGWTCPPRSGPR